MDDENANENANELKAEFAKLKDLNDTIRTEIPKIFMSAGDDQVAVIRLIIATIAYLSRHLGMLEFMLLELVIPDEDSKKIKPALDLIEKLTRDGRLRGAAIGGGAEHEALMDSGFFHPYSITNPIDPLEDSVADILELYKSCLTKPVDA